MKQALRGDDLTVYGDGSQTRSFCYVSDEIEGFLRLASSDEHLPVNIEYGGMDVSQAQEAKQLRDENTRLRKLVADLSLDNEALQSVIRKTPGARSPEGGCRAGAGGVCP